MVNLFIKWYNIVVKFIGTYSPLGRSMGGSPKLTCILTIAVESASFKKRTLCRFRKVNMTMNYVITSVFAVFLISGYFLVLYFLLDSVKI